jgi:hypothetical protein
MVSIWIIARTSVTHSTSKPKTCYAASAQRCGVGVPKNVCAALHTSRCNKDIGLCTLAPRLWSRTAVRGFVTNCMELPRDAQHFYYIRCYGAGSHGGEALHHIRSIDLRKLLPKVFNRNNSTPREVDPLRAEPN